MLISRILPLAVALGATLMAITPAQAQHQHDKAHSHAHDTETGTTTPAKPLQDTGGDTVIVDVNGLVCDFCARAVEKVFSRRDEVAGVAVDLEAKTITLAMKPGGQIDDATLKKLIVDSGYNVLAVRRGDTSKMDRP
ncbi:heavy-metal-associated domain-containing protein [Eilatimonas milleporae]|uniref:Copper chaperone CopZ n=1 Tax=Eilatimonas milleporae TaxID=911205 RepID=A0A3M0CH65_9PROT|nr:heavy metal-associated domain-containing protein [Eilatimonas milleporae]RMB08147.1 copper chaperone CopZ [Eilatimonas milleporae]